MRDWHERDPMEDESFMVYSSRRRYNDYWSEEQIATLVRLAGLHATTRQIALETGRTPMAVRLKASRMGLSLTAHEVRRGAKRHAKREGRVAEAELKSVRKRPRIAITVDFDLTALTRHERRQLAERLRAMDMEEGEANPVESPPADAQPAAVRRALKIPKAYEPSAATLERTREAQARRAANRKSLGWFSPPPSTEGDGMSEEDEWRAWRLPRRPRASGDWEQVSLEVAERELSNGLDPLERMELQEMLRDPEVQARLRALEEKEVKAGPPPYRPPPEDEHAKYRRYLRER